MSRVIPHRELRNNSSGILRDVKSGEVFEITNHGEVVAVLSPRGSTLPAGVRVRRAVHQGGFAALESITLDHPIQDALDELRAER